VSTPVPSRRLTALFALALQLLWAPEVAAQTDPYKRPVRSILEMRTAGVVMQKWDTSCGAAAITTVMNYRFDDEVAERTAALFMLRTGNPEKIKAQGGFSLLDLKNFASSRRYAAQGYKLDNLEELAAFPFAIVPVMEYGRVPHFVVVRSIRSDGKLDIADPAFGNRTVSPARFESIWQDRIVFVLERKDGRGS
jgi:uncharacterized protein